MTCFRTQWFTVNVQSPRRVDRYADGRVISARRRQKAEAVAEFVVEQFAGHSELEIVDFGCADGAIPVLLLRWPVGRSIRQITGITLLDYNDLPEKPAFAHPRFRRLIADLEGSLESLRLPWGACDIVLATAVFHYLNKPWIAFNHAARLLHPDGLLVASFAHPLMLRLRRRGLGTWLPPNNKIRHIRPLAWWQAVAVSAGFVELDRKAIQWMGLPGTTCVERWLRRAGMPANLGSNVLVIYRRR